MYLSPTDFIAENVSIFVKYMTNNKPKWYHGYVDKVIEYGVQDGHHYVDVDIQYEDDEDVTTETLWDYDYESDTEDAWRFTNEYTPLVQNVLNTLEERIIEEELGEVEGSIYEDNDTYYDGETDEDYETEEDTEDDESGYDDDQSHVYVVRRKPSFLNQLFGTLFVFSPLIATFAVVYNARDDITRYLRTTYC
jgi:hypothetical protein